MTDTRIIHHSVAQLAVALAVLLACQSTAQVEAGARSVPGVSGASWIREFGRGWPFGAIFAPAGMQVLIYGSRGGVLWDIESGQPIREFRGHSDYITTAAFSRDGLHVLTGGSEGTLKLLRVGDGRDVVSMSGHRDEQPWRTGGVTSIKLSSDGALALTADSLGRAKLWSMADGAELKSLVVGKPIMDAAFSADGLFAYTAAEELQRWRISTGHLAPAPQLTLNGPAVFSANGEFLLASSEGEVRMWRTSDGGLMASFPANNPTALAFSWDNELVLTGASDGKVTIWNVEAQNRRVLTVHDGPVRFAAFSHQGDRVVTGGDDGVVKVRGTDGSAQVFAVEGFTRPLSSVAFSPDGSTILTGDSDGLARTWRVSDGAQMRSFRHLFRITDVAFQGNELAVSASSEGTTVVWSVGTGEPEQQAKGPTQVEVSPDGAILALNGSGTSGVHLWRRSDGSVVNLALEPDAPSGVVGELAFSRDGTLLIGAHRDRAVLWEVSSGDLLRTFQRSGPFFATTDVDIAPDGEIAVGAFQDGTVILWKMADGSEIRRFTAHEDQITAVEFAPSGDFLLTAGNDSQAKLWRVADGSVLEIFNGHIGGIADAAFSPDGASIVTSGDDGVSLLWAIPGHALDNWITFPAIPTQTLPNRVELEATAQNGQPVHFRVLSGPAELDGTILTFTETGHVTVQAEQISDGAFEAAKPVVHTFEVVNGSPPIIVAQPESVTVGEAVEFSTSLESTEPFSFQWFKDGLPLADSPWIDGATSPTLRIPSVTEDDAGVYSVRIRNAVGTIQSARITLTPRVETWIAKFGYGKLRGAILVPDEEHILTYGAVGAFLWNIETGEMIRQVLTDYRVDRATFSPDGSLLLTAQHDVATIWRLSDGAEIHALRSESAGNRTHAGGVFALAFSPDGSLVATGGSDGMIKLWRVSDGAEVRSFTSGEGITSLRFSSDGDTLAASDFEEMIRTWRVSDGELLNIADVSSPGTSIVALAPDGLTAMTGRNDGTVTVWELSSGNELHEFQAHSNRVEGISFSVDGSLAVTFSKDEMKVWRLFRTVLLGTFPADSSFQGAFSRNSASLLTAGRGGIVALRNLDGAELQRFEGHFGSSGIDDLAFSADMQTAWIKSFEDHVALVDLPDGKLLRNSWPDVTSASHPTFSPTDDLLLTGSHDGVIHLWRASDGAPLGEVDIHEDPITALAISPDGRYVFSASSGQAVLWSIPDGAARYELESGMGSITTATFSPDGTMVMAGILTEPVYRGTGAAAQVWRVSDGALLRTFNIERVASYPDSQWVPPPVVAFTPDNASVLISFYGSTVLWNLIDGSKREEAPFTANQSIEFSSDGRHVLVANSYAGVSLWTAEDSHLLHNLIVTYQNRSPATFNPDSSLVFGVTEGKVAAWRVSDGTMVRQFAADGVSTFALSSDASMLLTGNDDGTVLLWRVDSTPSLQEPALRIDGNDLVLENLVESASYWIVTFENLNDEGSYSDAMQASSPSARIENAVTPGARQRFYLLRSAWNEPSSVTE